MIPVNNYVRNDLRFARTNTADHQTEDVANGSEGDLRKPRVENHRISRQRTMIAAGNFAPLSQASEIQAIKGVEDSEESDD